MTYLCSIVTRLHGSIVLISILIIINLSVCIVETKTCNDAKQSRKIVQIYIYAEQRLWYSVKLYTL